MRLFCKECGGVLYGYPRHFHKGMDTLCSLRCMWKWGKTKRVVPDIRVHHSQEFAEFRSRFEIMFAEWLTVNGFPVIYEQYLFRLGDHGSYTPDFFIPDAGFVEVKGVWHPGQRKKMDRFMAEYPEIPIVLLPWPVNIQLCPQTFADDGDVSDVRRIL